MELLCRACLSTGKDMIPMDSAFVDNFNLLTNLDIKSTQNNPIYTCNSCYNAVIFCTEFREKCIASDLVLAEKVRQKAIPNCEDEDDRTWELKQGIKLECAESGCDDPFIGDFILQTKDEDCLPKKLEMCFMKKVRKEPKEKKRRLLKKVLAKKKLEFSETLLGCGVCSKSFTNMDKVLAHLEHHKLDKNCGLCSDEFLDYTHLLAHRIVHLPEKQKKCHLCSRKCSSAEYLEFHLIKKHKLRGENSQVICKQCHTPYLSLRKLSQHILSVHSDIKYMCDECGKGFRIKTALRSHLRAHDDKKSFKCDFCDFTCKYKGSIREHTVRRHTEGKVYCKPCGRAFASQETLDKHDCKLKLGVICPVCGKNVRGKQLSRHLKTHTNVHRYQCDRCATKFKSPGAYKAHMNRHDGVKTFRCEYCPMSFYSQSVLIKHRRTHTGEKPYVCTICSKGFTGKNNLKVHMRVHGFNLIVKKNTQPLVSIFDKV